MPEEKAEAIITEVHRQGHLGEHKTWKAFNRKYYIPQGKQRCREVVRTCPECQLGKDYKARHVPKGHVLNSPGPWETISIDIVGPLLVDGKSNRYIVMMMDVYSKYLIAIPVRNHRASTVSRCLYESVVAYFGSPRSILSNWGAEFTGIIWESLTQMLGAKIKLTSPYYPQGNSVIERSHRTLSNMLRTMLLEKRGRDWSSLLPSVMLYMNSMIQEKTGVSACEILLSRNPNLPSDISFTPVTSLSNDREGYVKQLKRDLKDIRQKLSCVLGQNIDQSVNPFAVGDKVIIAVLPHENANRLMAKWKGPFTVTKVPNRFQIEYLDDNVTRLTHISYVKKYNERCQYTERVEMPRQKRVSQRKPWVRMAHLRLIAGRGHNRTRMVVPSMKAIQDKWPVHSGHIRVQILGEGEALPSDLQAVVDAAGPDSCMEGNVLVDLCTQRSGQRGSGCNAPAEAEELSGPMASPPRPPTLPAAQVRQYSWHHYAKNDVSDKRREFVGTNKRTNHGSPFLSQQAPLVSRVHLMKVVRKIGKKEWSKGKHLTDIMFKNPPLNGGKDMTSLLLPSRKVEEENTPYSVMCEYNSSGISLFDHEYQHVNDKCTLKLSKVQEKEREEEFKPSGSTNYDVMNDAALNSDITRQDVNRPIARKRYVPKKQSLMHSEGSFKSSLRACSRTFTFIALLLAIVINVSGGLFDIRLPERKSTVGTSASLSLFESSIAISCRDSLFRSILWESSANILGINEGLCPCMMAETIWNNNKQLIRRMEVLHNTKIRDKGGYVYSGCHGYAMRIMQSFARTFLVGKRLVAYIFLFADFLASSVFYFDAYTVNLESDDNFKVFYDLIYLYIYNVYRSWASCDWATYPEAILVKTYILVYFSSKVIILMIKSHDKYQSFILIGLAHAGKAYSRIRSVSVHYRSHWREWRPLVTPWACCIKEGIEP